MIKTKRKIFSRIKLISWIVVIIFVIIIARVIQLQIFQSDFLSKEANRQHIRNVDTKSRRGTIYDRNFNCLAVEIEGRNIGLRPKKIKNKREMAKLLSEVLNLEEEKVFKKISSKKNFVWLARKVILTQKLIEFEKKKERNKS